MGSHLTQLFVGGDHSFLLYFLEAFYANIKAKSCVSSRKILYLKILRVDTAVNVPRLYGPGDKDEVWDTKTR